jgi:hypothetical protein
MALRASTSGLPVNRPEPLLLRLLDARGTVVRSREIQVPSPVLLHLLKEQPVFTLVTAGCEMYEGSIQTQCGTSD